MAALLLFVVAALAYKTQAQCLPQCQPLTAPQQVVSPVVTTVIDNSVSNSLANAIQLLIVSNLIENTMKPNCAGTLPAVSVCDPFPCQPTVCSPTIDYFAPQLYDPIISPCDIIAPCEPIEIIPNICYPEVLPVVGCGCNVPNYVANIVPNYGCGCDGFGPNFGLPNIGIQNIGCGCDGFGPNFGVPNIGCGCDCGPKFGLPNMGCGCNNFGLPNIGYELLANALGPKCRPCDGPIFPQKNCNCGFLPNLPVGINVEPCGYIDPCSCPNKYGVFY